jgi:hypothetical protein
MNRLEPTQDERVGGTWGVSVSPQNAGGLRFGLLSVRQTHIPSGGV